MTTMTTTPEVSFADFARAYRGQLQRRDEIEIDLQAHIARVFARQERIAKRRLRTIRAAWIAHPVTAALSAPQLRARELISDDFDDLLDEEMEPVLSDWTDKISKALVGAAILAGSVAAQQLVSGLVDRLRDSGKTAMREIEDVLVQSHQTHEDFDTMAEKVTDVFQRIAGAPAALWARVQTTALLGGLATIAARLAKTPTQRSWITQQDELVRPDHADADGQIVQIGEPFDVGGEQLDFPGDPNGSAGNVVNCVLPHVAISGLVTAAMRSSFVGDIYEVTLANGDQLAATPDHLVLTRFGWRTVSTLQPGDDVLCAAKSGAAAGSTPNPADRVPTAEEAFSTAALAATRSQRMWGLVMDLHGEVTDREVQIERPDDPFPFGAYAEECEKLGHLRVPVAEGEVSLAGHPSAFSRALKPKNRGFVRRTLRDFEVFQTTDNDVSADAQPFADRRSSPTFVKIEPTNLVVETGAPLFGRGSVRDAEIIQTRRDRFVSDTEFSSQGASGVALLVKPPNLIADCDPALPIESRSLFAFSAVSHVAPRRYEGLVYDVSTPAGLYLTGGIVSHNCRCYIVFIGPSGNEVDESASQE